MIDLFPPSAAALVATASPSMKKTGAGPLDASSAIGDKAFTII
jgi:hypothetical protein